MNNPRKLEIGPGPKKISPEWTTIGDFGIAVDRRCVWGNDAIPFEDNTFDEIYSSHCLEHVPWMQVDYALLECFRVLKPGGSIEIHVPDFEYLVKCYLERRVGDSWLKYNNTDSPTKWVSSRVFSYGPGFSNFHKSCFDFEELSRVLKLAGFSDIERVSGSLADRLHGKINLGIKGVK